MKTFDQLPLYPTEEELAVALLGKRAKDWPNIAKVEEKAGLPRISNLYGGRYGPAVKDFYDRRHKLLQQQSIELTHTPKEGECFDDWKNNRARSAGLKTNAPQKRTH